MSMKSFVQLSTKKPVIKDGRLELSLTLLIGSDLPECFLHLAKDTLMCDFARVINVFKDTYLPRATFIRDYSDGTFTCGGDAVAPEEVPGDG